VRIEAVSRVVTPGGVTTVVDHVADVYPCWYAERTPYGADAYHVYDRKTSHRVGSILPTVFPGGWEAYSELDGAFEFLGMAETVFGAAKILLNGAYLTGCGYYRAVREPSDPTPE